MPEPAVIPTLAFDRVTVEYRSRSTVHRALTELSFEVAPGEAYGLVGESGCGKSTAAFAAMRYLGEGAQIAQGSIRFEGVDIGTLRPAELRALRGRRMAMVYQDPMSSLNPVMTIGRQLAEVPLLHGERDRKKAWDRAVALLSEVEIPDPQGIMARYPHELSGGQQQRVVIAMALMTDPTLLILDEPTTGLDVTVEAAVLDLVLRLRQRHNTAVLFISHNLGAVARVCDRVGVLYAGRLVEEGPVHEVFRDPRHSYTRGLLACLPSISARNGRSLVSIPGSMTAEARTTPACAFAPRCELAEDRCRRSSVPLEPIPGSATHRARCLRAGETVVRKILPAPARGSAREMPSALVISKLEKIYEVEGGLLRRRYRVEALKDVSLTVRRGSTLAIVGESGSGKSTIGRILLGLTEADGGAIRFDGIELGRTPLDHRPLDLRRRLQMIFQNPDSTLNPSHTIGFALMRPLRRLRGLSREEAHREAIRLLELVQLPADLMSRRPDRLSGGQKQRVAIARALAAEPSLVVADEPVSALDVSVQAAVVNLLGELQTRSRLSLVFISHDLGLVRHVADDVAVLYRGRVVEYGPVEAVFSPPFHPYTEALLSAVPSVEASARGQTVRLHDPVPIRSPASSTGGCAFAERCPQRISGLCDTTVPARREVAPGHEIACHLIGNAAECDRSRGQPILSEGAN